jgi:hypothetical protein
VIWPFLVSVAVFLVGSILALLQLRAVLYHPSYRLKSLLERLDRTPVADRVMVAALETYARSWEGTLARNLAAAEGEAARVDAASESVSDLALLYGTRSRWSWSALRIQLLGGVLAASLGVAQHVSAQEILVAVVPVAVGLVVTHVIGRAAADYEKKQRSDADKLVSLLLPSVHSQERTVSSRNEPRGRTARRRP